MWKPILIFIAAILLASTASQCRSAPSSATALASAPWLVIVTSAADSGPGTLRRALEDARPGDSITFDPRIFPPNAPVTLIPSMWADPEGSDYDWYAYDSFEVTVDSLVTEVLWRG